MGHNRGDNSQGIQPGRRRFVRIATLAAPATAVAAAAGGAALLDPARTASGAGEAGYRPQYFNADEWPTLNALVDRLIPADDAGPGALEAGVPEFIDRQMDLPYGHGELWYMNGPFHADAAPQFGYQLSLVPRELYRHALRGLDDAMRRDHGKHFSDLAANDKDAVLHQLEDGKLEMGEVPAATFFGQLLANTYEGYFCDPVHGGNRGMRAWQMIGFPGARADYMDWVRQYGAHYPLPPISRG
ncbi:gluconate 2-dehydrogenase subunit 3 family protein [Paraburkholderia kururiensis]|uniref:Gluconate 2-dehydrogenase subunit 3 family protein n=1 Tax=Paraburkholderia kururiensis TaxID=984307 RepID=A0ABZ0WSZ3_9BURK|nr:gluconate 2-dehydrogenase subunit 3 family protein [Paraburkholderia kururiensis]WQD80525.1 gluconate 2-dehydrogenase subunit 3 family protein [Paraburkholderia kururiensis]